ncbi:hypothetical protein AFAEC_0692 [Aliarcobacter faecis]|nr:hypothetical protein AFAEC_0692 [Aliarcobacter faecis]
MIFCKTHRFSFFYILIFVNLFWLIKDLEEEEDRKRDENSYNIYTHNKLLFLILHIITFIKY